jgi:hypothetical protein
MEVVHTNVMKVPLHSEQENMFIRGLSLLSSISSQTLSNNLRPMAILIVTSRFRKNKKRKRCLFHIYTIDTTRTMRNVCLDEKCDRQSSIHDTT